MDDSEFERRLDEGIRLEKAERWEEAAEYFADLRKVVASGPMSHCADAALRHANVLLRMGRTDDAQRAFDAALDAAKADGGPLTLGRALLGAGVFAASLGDLSRGEDFLLVALEHFHEVHGRDGVQGEGWTLVNLAALYGRTRRPDLAFVTFEKGRERLFTIENWVGVATAWEMQAELRDWLGDKDRAKEDLHEAMAFYTKEGMTAKASQIRERLGGRRVA